MLSLTLRNTFLRSPTTSLRSLSTSTLLRSEGAPSGKSDGAFQKREKAAEEAYLRDKEVEKLKSLRKSIDASKKHLEQLEKDHAELESAVKKE